MYIRSEQNTCASKGSSKRNVEKREIGEKGEPDVWGGNTAMGETSNRKAQYEYPDGRTDEGTIWRARRRRVKKGGGLRHPYGNEGLMPFRRRQDAEKNLEGGKP